MFKKGDIIWPVYRSEWLTGLYHAAVVWEDKFSGKGDFIGIVLTKSNKYQTNILMDKSHFYSGYTFYFKNTHFINHPFLKFGSWGPFKKVGQITDDGLNFIEAHIKEKSAQEFDEWRKNQLILSKS